LYEVEQALYDEIAKGKWLSTVDLEQLERKFFEGVPQGGQTPLDLLDLQKPLQPAKEIKLDLRKEGTLLAATTQTTCGPSPAQLRKGIQSRQTLEEGMRLLANADISVDRRHLRIAFIEKISSFEGIDKVTVLLDNAGTTVVGEVAAFKETSFTTPRNLPEGATLWLPLQHRSDNAKKSQRRWVARIVARIYVEAEERQILKAAGK
jgi:hypothetical protein